MAFSCSSVLAFFSFAPGIAGVDVFCSDLDLVDLCLPDFARFDVIGVLAFPV